MGLFADILFQPHRGKNMERAFVVAGGSGERLLAWRVAGNDEDDKTQGDNYSWDKTVLTPLDSDVWRGILKKELSVAEALTPDRDGLFISRQRRDAQGSVRIEPIRTRDRIADEHLPQPTVLGKETDDPPKPNPLYWLHLKRGVTLKAGSESHDAELAELELWSRHAPNKTVTAGDGTVTSAYRHLVVSETPDGSRSVRRYSGQLEAQIAVELISLP